MVGDNLSWGKRLVRGRPGTLVGHSWPRPSTFHFPLANSSSAHLGFIGETGINVARRRPNDRPPRWGVGVTPDTPLPSPSFQGFGDRGRGRADTPHRLTGPTRLCLPHPAALFTAAAMLPGGSLPTRSAGPGPGQPLSLLVRHRPQARPRLTVPAPAPRRAPHPPQLPGTLYSRQHALHRRRRPPGGGAPPGRPSRGPPPGRRALRLRTKATPPLPLPGWGRGRMRWADSTPPSPRPESLMIGRRLCASLCSLLRMRKAGPGRTREWLRAGGGPART